MPKWKDIANMWKNVGEIDLRPLAQAALKLVKISIVGAPGVGRHTLADQLRSDPSRPENQTQTPVIISGLEPPAWVDESDLIILMLDATAPDFSKEQALASRWQEAGRKLLIFFNKIDLTSQGQILGKWNNWHPNHAVYTSANNSTSLLKQFVPAVLELLPDQHLAIGRHFPLFRVPVAHELINDTCFSNAAYALSTGIAEVVPIFDVPLNVADMIVLSKAQAFLVYKLGLTFGFSTRWQDYVTEFGGVIGSGFMWRQIARSLIGLIPVWGIVPKVAISYAGTYVAGNVVLQWYTTGRQVTREQMKGIYAQALERGRIFAKELIARAPRPRLRIGRRKPAALPASIQSQESLPSQDHGSAPAQDAGLQAASSPEHPPAPADNPIPAPGPVKTCPFCGRSNASDARFCQYCGKEIPAEDRV